MKIYEYSAIRFDGILVKEIDEAENFAEICKKLNDKKYQIKSCKVLCKNFMKIKDDELLLFLKHIKYQHSASLSLNKSIESFIRVSNNRVLIFFLKKVLQKLGSGESITDSFNYLINSSLLDFLLILENTGDWDRTIEAIIRYIEMREFVKVNLFQKLRYPIFLLCFVFSIFLWVNELLLPNIVSISESSDYVTFLPYLYKIIFILIFVVGLLTKYSDIFILNNPMTKDLIIRLNNWYFSLSLAINLHAKLLLVIAVKNACSSIKNIYIRQEFLQIEEDLKSGISFSEAINNKKYITQSLKEYICIGESSNKFLEMLSTYNKIEESLLLAKMNNLGNNLVIGVTIFSGILLICMVLWTLTPIYKSLFFIDMME